MSEELKPCPICNGEMEIRRQGNDYTKKRRIVLLCKTFGCTVRFSMAAIKHDFDWLERRITERWNTRKGEK
jgi:hypothetical protein